MLRLLAPPVFEDEVLTRYAALLHRAALTLFVLVSVLWFPLSMSLLPANRQRWIGVVLGYLACTVAVLAINRSGWPRYASLLLTLFNWSVVSMLAWTGGGLLAPAAFGYMMVVSVAGALLGGTAGIYAGAVCCLSAAALAVAETTGLLPASTVANTSITRLAANASIIAMTAGILYLSLRSSKDALDRTASKVVEERRTGEAKFHALFENAGDAIFLMQGDRILDCNSRAMEMFDRQSRDRMVGQSVVDFSPPLQPDGRNSREAAGEKIAAALAGLPQRFGWMHTRSDGALFPAEVTLNAVELGGTVLMQAIVRDVSERKRAEEERERAFAMLQAALEQSPSAIVIADAPNVTVRWANAAALALRADPGEPVMGVDIDRLAMEKQFFRPDGSHYPSEERPLARAICRGETTRGEEVIIRNALGEDRWFYYNAAPIRDSQGAIVSGIVFSHDITERKRAEAVLRESETKFRTLFELVPFSMAMHDAEGRIMDANARLLSNIGAPREEVVGRPISDFYALSYTGSPEETVPPLQVLQDALRHPVELHIFHCGGGRHRIVLLSAAIVPLGGRQDILTCSVEITELRSVERQFRHAQKMEAIGRLAAGIAHDFNNLLTVIGGYTRMALTELTAENPLYGSLLEVSKAAERAEALTSQLLAFSRNQTLVPAVIDLNALVLDTDKLLRRLIGEGIELGVILSEGLPPVRVDAAQAVQVLMNLAVNAADAMPAGGRLEIGTAAVEVGEERARSLGLRQGAHVCLRVTDTGSGMDDATQSRIFEPFFTTKPEGKGTGLGLSTVYGIVKQSGGSIAVSSRPGAGSAFEILLPAVAQTELTPEGPKSEAASVGTETVLLAEDDQAMRKLAMQVLGRAGYVLLEAADGAGALAAARSHEGPIDLLVTDLKMPGLSGLEVARALRAERPGMAVLYMSGETGGKTLEEAHADEMGELILKPFSPGALLKRARRALDARRPAG